MLQIKTPGVYIQEASKLPPSVAQVETAIPAFIGYTEKAKKKTENDLKLVPTRITSMLEYVAYFGEANALDLKLKDDVTSKLPMVAELATEQFLMYYAMQMFFANGGGPCYIVSVGNYNVSSINDVKLKEGLATLEREDEPTLLVFPDAVSMTDEDAFYSVYADALSQANKMKDRFVIMDTYLGTDTTIAKFRNKVPGDKYGAAYYPHLHTVLTYRGGFITEHIGTGNDYASEKAALEAIRIDSNITNASDAEANEDKAQHIIDLINSTLDTPILDKTLVVTSAIQFKESIGEYLIALGTQTDAKGAFEGKTLAELKGLDPNRHANIQEQIKKIPVILPPSSAIAGIYAQIDGSRGVWKAPANIGLNYVKALTDKITNEAQERLNIDDVAGKSINAIRQFQGKGVLVWGARTLDGNSSEWRYVSIRRFFTMVEESVKKAMEGFVFESNNVNTWLKVQTMIENFLNTQWKAGALVGAKPEDAYYVSIGLDKTMSLQDVLEGRLIVEIGMAAVRPAEFIILKFSHKLQES